MNPDALHEMSVDSNGNRNRPVLAFSCDNGFAFPMLAAACSALRSTTEQVEIVVLDAGMTAETLDKVKRILSVSANLRIVSMDAAATNILSKFNMRRHQSVATYARLLMPSLVRDLKQCLYVDCDVLFTDDCSQLWKQGIEAIRATPAAAIQDYGYARQANAPGLQRTLETGEADATATYFNAGVLMMDLDAWREQELGERILKRATEEPGGFENVDQDAINLTLGRRIAPLDSRWNVQLDAVWSRPSIQSERAAAVSDPGLLHFTGPRKPWHAGRPRKERLRWMKAALVSPATSVLTAREKAVWLRRYAAGWPRVLRGRSR